MRLFETSRAYQKNDPAARSMLEIFLLDLYSEQGNSAANAVPVGSNKEKLKDWFVHPCVSSPQHSARHMANA